MNQIYDDDTKIQLKAKIKKQWPCKFTPKEAYYWGKYIGDRSIMRDLVTESLWAYKWAYYIGDREVMRERVTDSGSAFLWAKNIGDRVLMRNHITSSYWAYQWARGIGDREIMRKRVTDPKWKKQFESFFPKTKKMSVVVIIGRLSVFKCTTTKSV